MVPGARPRPALRPRIHHPERSTVRKVLAIFLPLLMLLTACGGADVGSHGKAAGQEGVFDSMEVRVKNAEEAPEVTFDSPLDITETAAKVVYEGDGDEVAEGQSVSFKFLALNSEDGSSVGDTYAQDATALPVNDQLKEQDPVLYDVLLGAKVGSQIAYAYPEAQQQLTEGQEEQPVTIMLINVLSSQNVVSPLSPEEAAERDSAGELRMSDDEVGKLEEEGRLPSVTFGEDGVPAVELPENVVDPEKLIVKVLEEGDGAEVNTSSTVNADYLGVGLADGETFDSSYERGEPSEFGLNQVISGWTYGLSGQKAGAKVLLVIPAELAYGDPASGGVSGPLAFVVDIKEVK